MNREMMSIRITSRTSNGGEEGLGTEAMPNLWECAAQLKTKVYPPSSFLIHL